VGLWRPLVVVEGVGGGLPESLENRPCEYEELAYRRTAVRRHGREHLCTTCRVLTLTGGRNVVFNEVQRSSS
jgi:hypothetical protein